MISKNSKAPHDTLVKEHFQNPENATSLIKLGLPAKILNELRLETLSQQGIHLSTPALLKSVTDLVFTCKLKDNSEAFVHILLEHKSQPDALVAVQVLKYMALIWDHYRRKNPSSNKLPFIIPLIFYHGQKEWEPKSLQSVFPQDSALLSCVPVFELPVFNLNNTPEEELRKDIFQNAMLILLKDVLANEAPVKIAYTMHLLAEILNNPKIIDTLELFFNYISYIKPEIKLEDIEEELAKLPEGGNMQQSILGQLETRGFEKGAIFGRQEGWQAGLGTTLFDLLTERFNTVPTSLRKKVSSIQDAEILRNLFKKAIKIDSLANFTMIVDKEIGNNPQ